MNNSLTFANTMANAKQKIITQKSVSETLLLKRGIWIYFLLLIFEGALRKWFLPGLSTPLLIVRDPIALWLIFKAIKNGLLPANVYMISMVFIGLIGIFTAIFLGHGDLVVALYGARILIIHFPLIFVIGNIFNHKDVENMGRVLLLISIPMVFLIAIQFYSPQSAWVNRGIGGDEGGAGFSGALGFFRPPGTFSFTNGNALFFAFVARFILYFWLNPKNINRFILITATIGLMAAIPLSISRGLFFSIAIAVFFAVFAMLRKPQLIGRVILVSGIGFISLGILGKAKFFTTSTEAFMSRFESANKSQGGVSGVINGRVIGGMSGALTGSSRVPFFGYGLGMGTNAGAMLLTGGNGFLISEEEWGRIIGELGLLLGIAVIFIRLALTMKISLLSFRRLNGGDLLPWMLLSFGVTVIPEGQWSQPTGLGFSTLIGGLIIASFNNEQD